MLHDNSTMKNLLNEIANNGVGFRELYFRTNLPTDALFDKQGEAENAFFSGDKMLEALVLKFSDGQKLLGTFFITPQMLDEMSESTCIPSDTETYSMHLVSVEKVLGLDQKNVNIELFFTSIDGLYGHTAGIALLDMGYVE